MRADGRDGMRALRIDLGALGRGRRASAGAFPDAAAGAPPGWRELAGWGGTALGLACLRVHAAAGAGGPEPLVLAAGHAVRAGLPTAARAAVQARVPLSGRYAEGHVGGELGARLAAVADALLLCGRSPVEHGVLLIEADGSAALLARPALAGAAPAETARALERELGPCSVLAVGPAGERGLPFASLAHGHAPPSFVGRGGMGAVLGGLGLKAVCVRAPARPVDAHADARALVELLARSPRLAERARGGTLELFESFGARGEIEHGLARGLADEARARAADRHGCRGCPTPCGWTFRRDDGARQGARFGASHALGVVLGLDSLDDALFLLGECDRLGVDAKEVGAVLALQCTARERGLLDGPSSRGDRAALAREIDALVHAPDAPGRAGAAALARALGLEHEHPAVRGQSVRPEASLAVLLGQCVSSGGADPMRSFPFLLESATHARLAELLAPLPVPADALDPASPRAKGRLVAWHEDLVTAVDLTGFCAFSAAGLLADGPCDVDALARFVLPVALRAPRDAAWAALAPGARLLAAGASLVLARHALNALFGAGPDEDRPPFARAALDLPGMLDEHRALRGLDATGRPRVETLACLGTPRVAALGRETLAAAGPAATPRPAPVARAPGRVRLCAGGALADVLGAARDLEAELPATVAEVLARVDAPGAGLFVAGRLVPAVWRAGRRLAPEDLVRSGDVLDLVVAVGGG